MAGVNSDEHKVTHLSDGYAGQRRPFLLLTDDYTIKEDQSNYVFGIATDAKTITLPATATVGPGFVVTIINMGADGNNIVTLSPNASDGIEGEIANAAADSHPGGVDGKDIVNTKSTAIKGDRVTVMSDGGGDWWVLEGVGIWAAEA